MDVEGTITALQAQVEALEKHNDTSAETAELLAAHIQQWDAFEAEWTATKQQLSAQGIRVP
jgi:hypothetical protein